MNFEGIPNKGAYKLAKQISYAELASSVLSTEWEYRKEYFGCKKEGAIAAPLQIFSKMVFTSFSPGS